MPTVLDELLVETRVSLAGLQTGIREAEQLAANAKGRITQELGAATFQVNTSEATASIRSLSEATIQLHASLVLLRAQTAQPFKISVDTSELRRAARDIADVQAALSGAPRGGPAQAGVDGWRTPSAPTSASGAVVVRGGGSATPIVVSGPVMIAGGGASGGGSFGGGVIPPFGGARLAISGPFGSGPTINMARNAAGTWTSMGGTVGGGIPPGGVTTASNLGAASAAGGMGLFGSIGTTIAYAAAFSAVYKIVSDIRDVWDEVIEGGQQFNAQMEVGTINIAALLSQTREFRTASGQTVDTLTNYKLQLGAAAGIQKELVRLDAETLGTIQDLQNVFAQVLAHGRGQVATDTQRLQLTTAILNASILMGNTQQQHTIEARQTMLGESRTGNVILQNLGISNRMVQSWRDQGVLIDKLLERLALFNKLGKDAGTTWEGLTNSLTSLSSLMAGITGKDLFEGQRHALLGQVNEMRRQQDAGEVFAVPLSVSSQEMETYGRNMAQVWLSVNQTIVGLQNAFLTLRVRAVNAAFEIAAAWQQAKAAIGEWVPNWVQKGAAAVINPGAAMMGGFQPQSAMSGVSSTEDLDTQSERLATRLNSLAAADTAQMSSGSFSQFLMALQQGQSETNKLRDAANQLHGTNQITEADWKRITNNLGQLNAAYSQTIAKFEKPLGASADGTKDDGKAAREHERLLREREAAQSAANSAELSLAQRRATITGSTADMQRMSEQKVEDERDKSLRRAGDDVAQRTAIWRRYYAEKANLEIDAAQRDIANSRRVGQIDEQESQRKLRAIQEQGRAQAFMTQAELSSVRRQIGIAQDRGAPAGVITPLLQREAGLIERDRTQDIGTAQQVATQSRERIAQIRAQITEYNALAAAAQKDPVLSELYRERLDQLGNELITWQSHATAAGQAQVTANERAIAATLRNIEEQRRLNATIGERIQDRLANDSRSHMDNMADIGVRGVYRISDALSDMANKGKFSFKSLVQAANEMANDITREMMRDMFRNLLLGKPMGGQGGQEPGQGQGQQRGAGGLFGWLGGLFGGQKKESFGNVIGGGSSTAATVGIQQITTLGTTASTTVTQVGTAGLTTIQTTGTAALASLQTVTASALAAIQAAAAGASGGGLSGIFGGVVSGGSSTAGSGTFGNVTAGGSSTAAIAMHSGGLVPHFANGGFVGNEVPAILHKGEMVLSAAETRNLMRYGSAKLPIGGGGGGARSHGGGNNTIVHMTVNTPDANSFMRNQSQIETKMAARMQYSARRNG